MPISKIKTSGIEDSAITSAKIGVDVIVAEDIANNAITVAELSDGAVTSAKLDTNIDIAGTLDVTGATTLDDGLTVDNDGATVATFDRATDNGTIAEFQKDGTAVGSVGTYDTDIHIGSGATGVSFYDAGNTVLPFNPSTPVYRDNAIDLGNSSNRFKDLYLSGGVVFGSTGGSVTSKTLDDYEEGTWTPSFSASTTNPSITYSYQHGSYTKIGNLIYYAMNVNGNISGGSGVLEVRGFPFPTPNNSIYSQLGGGIIYGDTGASTVQYSLRLQPNTYYGYIQEYQDNSGDFAIDISSVQGTFVIQMSGVAQTT